MNSSKKLALNGVIQIGGKVVMTLVGFITVKVLTTLLGLEGYGEYMVVTSYLIIAGVLAEFGLNIVLTTEISAAKNSNEANKAVSNIFTMRLVIAIIVIGILSLLTLPLLGYAPHINQLIAFGVIGTIFLSLSHVLIGIFQKHLRTDKITIADLIARCVLLIGVIIASIWFEINLWYVMMAYVAAGIAQWVFISLSARKYYSFSLAWDLEYWKKVFFQALPLFIIIAFNLIYYRIDTIMLSVMDGSQAVGLYGVSYKILEISITFPGMLVGLLLPILTRYFHHNTVLFRSTIQKGFNILFAFAIPLVITLLFLADDIIEIISSTDFSAASLSLQILAIGVGGIFFSNFFGHILIAANLQKKSVGIAISGAIINVVLNIFLIPQLSFIGAAIATAITEVFVLVCYLILVRITLKERPHFQLIHMWVLVSGLVMTSIFLIFSELNVIIQFLIAASLYLITFSLQGLSRMKSDYAIYVTEE